MQIAEIALTIAVVIILFEVLPVKSFWSIPVRQPADEHVIAVPGSGGFSFLLMQKQEEYKTLTREQQRFWKRILIVDDDNDITTTFKTVIEESNKNNASKRIEVYTCNDPILALSDFKPHFYDLLLLSPSIPTTSGFIPSIPVRPM